MKESRLFTVLNKTDLNCRNWERFPHGRDALLLFLMSCNIESCHSAFKIHQNEVIGRS